MPAAAIHSVCSEMQPYTLRATMACTECHCLWCQIYLCTCLEDYITCLNERECTVLWQCHPADQMIKPQMLPGRQDAVQSHADHRQSQNRHHRQSALHLHWMQTGHIAASLLLATAEPVLDPNCNKCIINCQAMLQVPFIHSSLLWQPTLDSDTWLLMYSN